MDVAITREPKRMEQGGDLLTRVVSGGYCVGCGACAVGQTAAHVQMARNADGTYTPAIDPSTSPQVLADAARRCPFTGAGPDESEIAASLYPRLSEHPEIGRHLANYAGWVNEGDYRARGSSGGLLSWIATRLLETGKVDAVVHVRPQQGEGAPLFAYTVSSTAEEVRARSKSRYYPVEMSGVLEMIRASPGKRFALVGVPCFIKAARLVAKDDPRIADGIAFTLALVCGHLKSAGFAEYLSWQCGVAPSQLARVDFRHKLPGRPASSYAFQVESNSGKTVTRAMSALRGRDWGMGYFKLSACEYCDDILGETADVSVGDAWLPDYVQDSRGTNVVVVRSPVIAALLNDGARSGAISLDQISADTVAESQRSGINHRREGLAWRLAMKDASGEWRPPKRVQPRTDMLPQRQRIYAARLDIMAQSHRAFALAKRWGWLHMFELLMRPAIGKYHAAYGRTLMQRLRRRLRRMRA